jgi:hypothetical protein
MLNIFKNKQNLKIQKLVAAEVKKLQASGQYPPEGVPYDVYKHFIPGVNPTDRLSQAKWMLDAYETYKLGSVSFRSVAGLFSAMLAGDGPEIYSEDERTKDFIDSFFKTNNLYTIKLQDLITYAIVYNYVTFNVKKISDLKVPLVSFATPEKIEKITENMLQFSGYPGRVQCSGPFGSAVGLGLFQRVDELKSKLEIINNKVARPTPTVEVASRAEAMQTTKAMKDEKWLLGDIWVGTGKFSFAFMPGDSVDSLTKELLVIAKTFQILFGIPVHWSGHVEEMSNRATAEELHAIMATVTQPYRDRIVEFLTRITNRAFSFSQNKIQGVQERKDFEIGLAPLNLTAFKEMVDSLISLKKERVVTPKEIRGYVPGMTPRVDISDTLESETIPDDPNNNEGVTDAL